MPRSKVASVALLLVADGAGDEFRPFVQILRLAHRANKAARLLGRFSMEMSIICQLTCFLSAGSIRHSGMA